MAKPLANLGLFVAIYPPPEHVARLLAMLKEIDLPRHRPTPADQIHLTLHFIGDMPESEMESTYESVERSAAGIGPHELAIERLITLPERGPSRLVAAETSSPPQLLEIQRRLAMRLAVKPSNRDYQPHITLTRFAAPDSRLRIEQAIADELRFTVDRLHLMRSTLRSEGAVHHLVREFPLTP